MDSSMKFKTKDLNKPLKKSERVKMSDFILSLPNSLDSSFCKKVIKRFENDPRKEPGTTGDEQLLNPSTKQSTDLHISDISGWKDIDDKLCSALSHGMSTWYDTFAVEGSGYYSCSFPTFDNGYKIQRTEPGQYYSWHHDFMVEGGLRFLTYIWYLNDIDEGGYTEFCDGTQIKPEEGKLILFPATWTYSHRGFPPKNQTKYIVTGWVHDSYFTNVLRHQ